jgi:hypothetical protein
MRSKAIFALIFLTGCATGAPEVGQRMRCRPTTAEAVTPSQVSPVCEITEGGIVYRLAADARNRVSYLSTSDNRLVTPEGIRVGSSLSDVLKSGGTELVTVPGFKRYSCLPSGWCASFAILDLVVNAGGSSQPTTDDTVYVLFKGKDYNAAPN